MDCLHAAECKRDDNSQKQQQKAAVDAATDIFTLLQFTAGRYFNIPREVRTINITQGAVASTDHFGYIQNRLVECNAAP